jgi:uncharacterized protein (TIGR02217 family)
MNFHEIRFPDTMSFGSLGGPERRTEIVTLNNGFEERNSPWAHSRRRFDAGMGMRSLNDLETLVAFFEARHGQLFGFRWKDWTDYKSCLPEEEVAFSDQTLGVGDGSRTEFQLIKRYASGGQHYDRPIVKPVSGTVLVALDGIVLTEGNDFSLDVTQGALTLSSPPATGSILTAGFEFDVPVRFDSDRIETSVASFSAGEVPHIPVVEVRV